ncbi:hypothetical protein [Dyadobacter pollutisoli]|uniref:Uncharacterized protein n=1 Tax=Dyadobacter pollutisoli TaxID=2910158 RepID=A0A9E8NB42_9BACT|nr:hypothetical protein [Dyadobacter pollutisoli]WAC11142.1 hypothetical protein ON006_25825 [Dyadobacter pollutisoli]
MKAKVNGRAWQKTYNNAYQTVRGFTTKPDSANCFRKSISVYSMLYDSEGVLQQLLSFEKIPVKPGRYHVAPVSETFCKDTLFVQATLETFIDEDIFRDRYEILSLEENYLHLNEYQENGSMEIKGTFSVSFVLRSKRYSNSFEDTLRFTNGQFHTKIVTPVKRHL